MQKLLYVLSILAVLSACSKDQEKEPESKYEGIVGTWTLTEMRADPGDGSGKWEKVNFNASVIFTPDGSYYNSRGSSYNKYTLINDTITLYNNNNPSDNFKLYVQELNTNTLAYYLGGFWCGGPTGEKFVRYSLLCNLPQ